MIKHIIERIYRAKTILYYENKIKLLGSNFKYNVYNLLLVRLIISIIIFVLFLVFSSYGFLLAPIISILFYILSEKLFIDLKIYRRKKKLEKEALFFFQILVLTLESGHNLKGALELTCRNVSSELSLEFLQVLNEVYLGKSLSEALESMKKRVPSETINNTILNFIEANMFGNSILDSLYTQIDYLRDKQLLEVKANISKLPTKISVISVLFYIPIMLLLILAPVLINYLLK